MFHYQECADKNDIELIQLTLKDKDFFTCLVKKYEQPLLRYIRRISAFNTEAAEDILQEVFIKVYQNLNEFDQTLKFSSWLYRITHNQTINHYRRLKNQPQGIYQTDDTEELNRLASQINIEREINNRLNGKIINKVLACLDIKYREVLILKFLEEKSYQEISDILKKPMGTVATLINRAKKQFKQELIKQKINL